MKFVTLLSLLFVTAINGLRPGAENHGPSRLQSMHGGNQHGPPQHPPGRPMHAPEERPSDEDDSLTLIDNEFSMNSGDNDGKFTSVNFNVKGVPTITFCNTTSTPLIVNSYTISPDDIEPDEDVTVTLHTTLTETVTSGTIKVVAKVDKFPVLDDTYDLCTEIQQADLSCPLSPQKYDISQTIDIPSIPISGTVDATVTLYDQSNKELACIEMVCKV